MIEPCDYIQRIGNKIKMSTDGRVHYHIYKTEEKAEIMYRVFSKAIEENGGVK